MLSIAIYSNTDEDIITLKSLIQDFLIEQKIMAKTTVFRNAEDIIMFPARYDIYFIDMETETDVIGFIKKIKQIDADGQYICMSSNSNSAALSAKARADFFITKPYDKEEIYEIILEIKKEIKQDSVIIKIPGGERRIRTNHLNYIDIVKRCLCYHLQDGTMFDGQTLRTSFEKAIDPLQHNPQFLFLPPSLLINLSEIKIINGDNLIFENDSKLFFPKKAYDTIREAWINYNKIN